MIGGRGTLGYFQVGVLELYPRVQHGPDIQLEAQGTVTLCHKET